MVRLQQMKTRSIFCIYSGILAFYENRRAVTAIEYALIAGVITAAIVGSLLSNVGPQLTKTFNTVASEL